MGAIGHAPLGAGHSTLCILNHIGFGDGSASKLPWFCATRVYDVFDSKGHKRVFRTLFTESDPYIGYRVRSMANVISESGRAESFSPDVLVVQSRPEFAMSEDGHARVWGRLRIRD